MALTAPSRPVGRGAPLPAADHEGRRLRPHPTGLRQVPSIQQAAPAATRKAGASGAPTGAAAHAS
eukprot:4374956-Alexandrium_andersonii.AAC.1